jgi:hypothetical protein
VLRPQVCDMTFEYLSNGDDGYCLVKMGRDASGSLIMGSDDDVAIPSGMEIIDCIGDWDAAPAGGAWDVCGVGSTKDNTLVRKCGVNQGNRGNSARSFAAATCEWDVMGADFWDKGGFHSGCTDDTPAYDCSKVTPSATYHFASVDAPEGASGFMGWNIVAQDATCALIPTYHGDTMQSGVSSWHNNNDGCHDGAHDTLITRSAAMWGPVSFTAMLAGGMGSAETAGADDQTIADGFIGLAVRKVSDGSYVGSVRAKCPAGTAFGFCSGTWESVSMPPTGVAGEQYTIDIIDNYAGGWGWFLVNDIVINPAMKATTMFGDATQSFEALGDGPFAGWQIVAQDAACPVVNEHVPGQQISGISTYACHDSAHSIQIVRSPEVWGPVSFSVMTAGGMGTAVGPGPNDRSINNGFMGYALRRVSDGAYVAATRASCPAGTLTGYCSGRLRRVPFVIMPPRSRLYIESP